MEIKLLRPADESLIKETIIKWNLAAKKNFSDIAGYFLICIVYLAIGFGFEYKKHGIWNFGTSVALCFGLLILISFYSLYKGRKIWLSHAKYCIDIQKGQPPIEYTFSDNLVTIRDSESYAEIKWSAFSYYRIHKTYIFLYLKSHETSNITINRSYLSNNEDSALFSFISTNFTEKK